ncbi:MurR/RpiR family transcriptional regulator [Bacillus aquiflavi]|uniref:MurR/RpiR family transcriptional regulator n=1 Tax=Bacillus aquiflavi TaxID=2672567 RepID=A0A6B3VZV7_9BACI|nr:MurR/RpiR family transcriptional regulator [Bacillus aquiflavi]MBA4536507.1 MurR/RpiR family transcriptional regulator [Bacillus aquiflavi]NEY80874.1 MurR/RpiR family transcriptional regulator [Bacillus aquiflavi]UAC49598.1 MurR/RpiR family transcriptional regulator [Bacillus aquiflavi]
MTHFKTLVKEHYHQLSKSQQKVAKYLLEQPGDFAIKSAQDIGKEIGVSETTVIRFCYSLNFNGFSELQKNTREALLQKSSLDEYHEEKLKLAKKPHLFASVMEQDSRNIRNAIHSIHEEDFQLTVEQIVKAEKVFICGLRSSFAAAQWLTFTLNIMRDQVFLFRPETDDLLVTLPQLNENTVFIGISFHRYLKETVELARIAKEQNAFVCGITDSPVSPISKYTSTLLATSETSTSTIDATPILFSILNALVANVSVMNKERIEKRKEQYESFNIHHFFAK